MVGDPVYGEHRDRPLGDARLEALCRTFPRQALHAWRLRIRHPLTGEHLELEAPLPADLRELLRASGLEAGLPVPEERSGHESDPYFQS